MALKEVFEHVAKFFEECKMDYAVIGAFALYGFGYVRATRDIDFVTRIENQGRIKSFLENLGFNTDHCSSAFSNHLHPVGNVRVDIMYVEGNTADEIFAHVQKRILFRGHEYPVVAPEHLIAMKLFAASQNPERKLKDLADVREIIRRTDINRETIKKLFAKYRLEKYYDDVEN